jgi:hypothetical protein
MKGALIVMEIARYGKGTNVPCRVCKRRIFVTSPTKVFIHDGGRYLMLKCPSPGCSPLQRYKENELEIH